MSDSTYPDFYSHPNEDNAISLEALRALVQQRLTNSGTVALPPELQERLEAELAWIERGGAMAAWVGLARLVDTAHEKRIPLGAPLGMVDGTLAGAALLGLPDPTRHLRPLPPDAEASIAPLPIGVEVPRGRREDLLRGVADEGNWAAWTPQTHREGQIALWLRPSTALSTLDAAITLAREHLAPGFDLDAINLSTSPALSDEALALLKQPHLGGIPYLSPEALKGYNGDLVPESVAALVARSGHRAPKYQPKAPEGIEPWTEHTADTSGALLYLDQFASLVEAVAGIPPQQTIPLRLAMLNPGTDPDSALKSRFIAGCLNSGLDAEASDRLYSALASAAAGLVSRHVADAWARVALWLLVLKARHPAAFFAAALDAAWERRGRAGVATLVIEARRIGLTLLPPHAELCPPTPAPEQFEAGRAVRWGLATLPGWDRPSVERFVAARTAKGGCSSLRDLALIAVEAELSPDQVETLALSGACDHIGGRDELQEKLTAALEWARGGATGDPPTEPTPKGPSGPLDRYTRWTWEEQHLGVGFTSAPEMDRLRLSLDKSAGLRARLMSSVQVGESRVGGSVLLVGLLHAIRLFDWPNSEQGEQGEQGEQLAVAQVEDLDGSIELVAFPPNYKRHRDLWVESNPVIVTARVMQHSDGAIFLLCEHLAPFDAHFEEAEIDVTLKVSKRGTIASAPAPQPQQPGANGTSHPPAPIRAQQGEVTNRKETPTGGAVATTEPPTYRLVITLPGSNDDHADIDRMIALNRLFQAHPGPDTVMLRIPYSPQTGEFTSAQLPRGVRYTASLELEIRDLLGPDSLALIKLVG